MIHQRITSTRVKNYSKHYCPQCADEEGDVQYELALAVQAEALEIGEDVTDEVCAHCGRRIADVSTEERLYQLEVAITFTVGITLPSRSATAAEHTVRRGLRKITYEDAEEAIQEAINDGVSEEAEIDDVSACYFYEEAEPAKVALPEQDIFVLPAQLRQQLRQF